MLQINLKDNITEIHFENDNQTNIDNAYALVDDSLKADLTYNNLGSVKAWLVSDIGNEGMYKLYIKSNGKTYLNTGAHLFEDFKVMTEIDLSNIETMKVTDMSFMFSRCLKVQNINLSNFDTSNVTTMYAMLMMWQSDGDKPSLNNLDVSSFNTSNVTTMRSMFAGPIHITDLDLSNFNTENVTSMYHMFMNNKINSLDISNFNTSSVLDMIQMFWNTSLEKIYVINGFTTNSVTKSSNMFQGCSKLVGGNGTTYDSSHTNAEYARIDGKDGLKGYFTDIKDKVS